MKLAFMTQNLTKRYFLIATLLFGFGLTNGLKAQDSLSAYILTPKAGPEPRINGPKVFGVRPGNPIVYTVPVSGQKPVSFSAINLPKGVKLDAHSGRLSGSIAKPGAYEVTIRAKNALKEVSSKLKIVVGEDILLTPPMG